jgi:hypothetical protein
LRSLYLVSIEAATIESVIASFRTQVPQAAIVVGDNNSADNTGELAQQAGEIALNGWNCR